MGCRKHSRRQCRLRRNPEDPFLSTNLRTTTPLAAFCCGIGLVAPALAASLSSADRDFLTSTAQGANYELSTAKLALTKSKNGDIKSYARTMMTDHQTLDPKLHRIAKQNGIDLPTMMTGEKQRSYNRLKSLGEKAFDTAFVKDEAQDNQNDIGTEQKEIESTDNASLKAFVQQLKQADTKHAKIGRSLQQAGQ